MKRDMRLSDYEAILHTRARHWQNWDRHVAYMMHRVGNHKRCFHKSKYYK